MSELTALELATLFHVIYERKSAEFNYITRTDTRIFDPESSNGKLMIATCEEILSEDIQPKFDALTARNEELTSKLARMEAALQDIKTDWSIYQFYRPELRERVDVLLLASKKEG